MALPQHREHSGERFLLEIPPDPSFIGTARLFGASIGRSLRLPEGSVEDIKLAVSEACGYLMVTSSGSLKVEAEQGAGRLGFQVTTSSRMARPPADEAPLGLEVIKALFPDARIIADPPSIGFSVPLPGEPPTSD